MATTKLTGTLIRSGSIPTSALGGGVVTSSGQIVGILPAGTVSASSQIDYNSIQNKLSGVVSSSTQVQPLLPGGTVSSSGQVSYTGLSNIPAGIVSSSTQLPAGTVSSSTQVVWSSVSYNAGIVSSSTQVAANLPVGTVSSSAQYPGWVTASSQINLSGITGTTFAAADFVFPQSLKVTGNLTATQFNVLSSSIIYTSGSTQFGDTPDDVMSVTGSIRVLSGSISGSMVGMFSSSAQVSYTGLSSIPAGIVSSSTQVQPLLPNGTVSSSAQYPGWMTSSAQVVWSSVSYNAGIVSSSTQVQPLLPGGTVSSSTQTVANIAGQYLVPSGSNYQGVVSGSGAQYRLVVPVGTNLYAN